MLNENTLIVGEMPQDLMDAVTAAKRSWLTGKPLSAAIVGSEDLSICPADENVSEAAADAQLEEWIENTKIRKLKAIDKKLWQARRRSWNGLPRQRRNPPSF